MRWWKRFESAARLGCRVAAWSCVLAVGAGPAAADDYTTALMRGAKLARQRSYPAALAAFQEAVRADPSQVDGYLNAGNVAKHLNRCKDVLLMFRGFLYLAPQDPEARNAKAAIAACEAKATGTLTVKTDVAGAEVLVDGGLIGRTPITDIKLAAGTYRIDLRHPDYEDAGTEVTVTAGQPVEAAVTMNRKLLYGFLEVKTDPADGVQVFLDDAPAGVTPLSEKLRLETKKYLLRLEKAGYDRWIRNVTIQRDRTLTVNATLEPLAPPGAAPAPQGR